MTLNRFKSVLFTIALVAIGSCASDPDDTKLIWDIDGDVRLAITEQISDGAAQLNFDIRTQDAVFCENASILYRLDIEDQQLDLRLVGVDQGEGCPSPDEYAYKYVDLPQLDKNNYAVSVTVPSRADIKGLLRITESAYVLDLPNVSGLVIPQRTLFKTPVDLIFGWYSDLAYDVEAVNALINRLTPLSRTANLPVGTFQLFERTLEGIEPRNDEFRRPKNIFAHFSGSTQDLENIMSDWREEWGTDIDLFLFDATGKRY